jgi:sugar phosphate isomerase/epimerase
MHSQNRRTFLKQIGTSTLALSFLPLAWQCTSNTTSTNQGTNHTFGLQLYTLRDILPGSVESILQKVSEMGYTHIETYGIEPQGTSGQFLGHSIQEFSSWLEKHKLKTFSGHYNLEGYLNPSIADDQQLHFALDCAQKLGQSYVIAPVPPIQMVNELGPAEYEYIAQRLNDAGKLAREKGIKIGYHNHFWEFRTLSDGRKGIDILLNQTNPEDVIFEMDLFWTERAGFSNIDYFTKHPGRFPLWHIKDMDPSFNDPMLGPSLDTLPLETLNSRIKYTEVGTGSIDFKAIWKERELAGAQYFFIEQDFIYKDKLESIAQSLQYVKEQLK